MEQVHLSDVLGVEDPRPLVKGGSHFHVMEIGRGGEGALGDHEEKYKNRLVDEEADASDLMRKREMVGKEKEEEGKEEEEEEKECDDNQ